MKQFFSWLFRAGPPVFSDAGTRDAAAIARLHGASFRRGWSEDEVERLLADRSVIAHRCMQRLRLTGFILSRMAADEAEILSVAVDTGRQGSGIGRRLLEFHLGRLAARGTKTVFLEVDEGNRPARRLYERAGFREVGRREAYYSGANGPAPALILRRDVD
jgi:ribosomal-protein-alanine N-acetyltransferase